MSKTIIKKGIALFAALIIIGCNLIMVVEAATTPSTIEITGLETQSQELKSLLLEVNLMLPSTESDENFIPVEENPISQPILEVDWQQQLEELQEIINIKHKENLRNSIVAYADQFVGNPYVWGGNSLTDGCDCSHFVWLVLRDTIGYSEGWIKSTLWLNRGTVVNGLVNAQAGDVVVYSGHVALYDGNGYLIEALNRHKGIVHERKIEDTNFLGIRRFV